MEATGPRLPSQGLLASEETKKKKRKGKPIPVNTQPILGSTAGI
jgi:hypothetical protein